MGWMNARLRPLAKPKWSQAARWSKDREQPEQVHCSIANCVLRARRGWNQSGDGEATFGPIRASVNATREFCI